MFKLEEALFLMYSDGEEVVQVEDLEMLVGILQEPYHLTDQDQDGEELLNLKEVLVYLGDHQCQYIQELLIAMSSSKEVSETPKMTVLTDKIKKYEIF
jgi:hypothetical protein